MQVQQSTILEIFSKKNTSLRLNTNQGKFQEHPSVEAVRNDVGDYRVACLALIEHLNL